MDTSWIVESLRPLAVPIESLALDPENVRSHPVRNMAAVVSSLKRYGQRKPVVVNRVTGFIEAGNGTLEAARELGKDCLAVVYVEDDPETAMGYAIADNRTADLAEWNWQALGGQLQELLDNDFPVGELGWEPYEYEPLLAADWTPPAHKPLPTGLPGDGEVKVVLSPEEYCWVKAVMDDLSVEEVQAIVTACRSYLDGRL